MQKLTHPIAPIWNENSKLLILGSFPSVRSREENFFYAHKQNRFWRVLSSVFNAPVPLTVEDKKRFLLDNGIALWDVVASCEIDGSEDSSIKNVTANDISPIISASHIRNIYVNGATAAKLYNAYIFPQLGINAIKLPSTSPANAAWSFEKLCSAWGVIAR